MPSRATFALALVLIGCGAPAREAPSPRFTPPGRSLGAPAADDGCAAPHALTRGSARFVRELRGKMVVKAYVTTGHPVLDGFVADLRALLQHYADASGGKVTFEVHDVATAADRDAARDAGLQRIELGTESAPKDGFMGLVLTYGSEQEPLKALSPDAPRGLEFWITNKMREVRDRAEGTARRVGVLVGHDEARLSDPVLIPPSPGSPPNLQSIFRQYFPFYRFVDVDLDGGAREIDESLDGLLVLQPAKDISEKELWRIDAFVMKGRSLAVVASAVNLRAGDPSGKATLATHGLDVLLGGYGVRLHKDVVLDFERPFRVEVFSQNGPQALFFPPLLDVQDDPATKGETQLLDATAPALFRIPQVSFPYASSLGIERERQPEAKLRVLARSTPKSEVRTGDTLDLGLLQKWTAGPGRLGQVAVAASVEGPLRSAFGEGKTRPGGRASRVLVFASAQLFVNPFVVAGNPRTPSQAPGVMLPSGGDETLQQIGMSYAQKILTNQILVAKNTVDWLTGDEDLLEASAKLLPSACAKKP